MWISDLELTSWRNHKQTRLSLETGTTVFWGENGHGKTNVVEAIRFLAKLDSHRTTTNEALIGDHSDSASLFTKVHSQNKSVKIGLVLNRKGPNQAFVNNSKVNMSELPVWLSCVMFAPEDFAIIRGEPSFRRNFLNDLAVNIRPVMLKLFRDYDRLLKQRNTLLKTLRASRGAVSSSALESWTSQIALAGAEIISQRLRIITDLRPLVVEEYQKITGGHEISMSYAAPNFSSTAGNFDHQAILDYLETEFSLKRSEEIEKGTTLVGPHRHDFELFIRGKPTRTHASQGETWSLALALRLSSASYVNEARSTGFPVLILDDVFAELDANRRNRLVEAMARFEQVIVTTAIKTDVPIGLSASNYQVVDGVIV